jgi:hypothetical protein
MSPWSRAIACYLGFCFIAFACPCMSQKKPAPQQKQPQLDCDNPPDLSTFINCRIDQLASLQVAQKDPAKQTEAPSSSATASSLVDKSSVSDIVGMALDAAGLSSASSQPNTSSTTGSLSAYAIRNWIEKKDSLDPSIYAQGLNWRRFSLLLGRDFADSSKTTGSSATPSSTSAGLLAPAHLSAVSSTTPTSGSSSSQRGVIAGAKAVLWARRDASNSHNATYFKDVGYALAAEVVPFARATLAIQNYLDAEYGPKSTIDRWTDTWRNLTATDKTNIDKLLSVAVTTSTTYYNVVDKALTRILEAPQLSATYQADIKLDNGGTLQRTALIFDKSAFGTSGKVLTSSNLGFDYTDKTAATVAKKQFRASGDIQFPLWSIDKGNIKNSRQLTLELSGQGQWGTKSPVYQTQIKLSIPLVTGVAIPLSCGYANQTQLLKETNVFGHVGVTLDLAKLLVHSKQ